MATWQIDPEHEQRLNEIIRIAEYPDNDWEIDPDHERRLKEKLGEKQ